VSIFPDVGRDPQREAPARAALDRFRVEAYESMGLRGDALFELGDAIACSPMRVTDIAIASPNRAST
jgi:hypothetical protein